MGDKKTLTVFFDPVSCMEEMPCFFRYSSIFSSSMASTGTLRQSFWNSTISKEEVLSQKYNETAGNTILKLFEMIWPKLDNDTNEN